MVSTRDYWCQSQSQARIRASADTRDGCCCCFLNLVVVVQGMLKQWALRPCCMKSAGAEQGQR